MAKIRELNSAQKQYLEKIFYSVNHASSYRGIDNLMRTIRKEKKHKINRKQLINWLSSQETYTAFKPAKRSFKRRKIIAISKNHIWELDCAYMTKYKNYNNNYKFFLLCVDVLSRYVRTFPLKTLQGKEMVEALSEVTKDAKPTKVRSDFGSEFINKHVKDFWAKLGVEFYYSRNEVKSALAERSIQTLKSKLVKYMHKNKTKKWVKALSSITKSYNDTYHRSLKMSPSEAMKKPNHELYFAQYFTAEMKKNRKFKFNINDKVKISVLKKTFQRAYDEKWSKEVFFIMDRWKSSELPVYRIKSMTNEPIVGTFYEEELQLVSLRADDVFIIERVIKTRIKNKKEQSLIKWLGYETESWIDSDQIENV